MEMKFIILLVVIVVVCIGAAGFYFVNNKKSDNADPVLKEINSEEGFNILFLHHSTGNNIWKGGVKEWFDSYNKSHDTNYTITEQSFPKTSPYGWNNYPFDYWNIWVNHAGEEPYMDEPTLEIITKIYDIVIWKHCFPVSNIQEDTGDPSISSEEKRIENYKLQYDALKEKMKEFPDTKFIIWTIASLVESSTSEEKALRAQEFYNWVKDEWDEKGDNVFLWDFYILETEGGIYLKNDNAASESDSHPNSDFSKKVAPYFCQRIIDVIEGNGDNTKITGENN